MSQPQIHAIVEGDGEVEALPHLLRRWLYEERQRYEFGISTPINAHGSKTLHKQYERFLELLRRAPNCAGALVLLDTDGDQCPITLVHALAPRAQQLNLPFPVALVSAHCEYEAWFLASASTVASVTVGGRRLFPNGFSYDHPVEERRGVKRWLSDQMEPGRIYKETQHQAPMTKLIDFALVRARSRSFRRLEHALDELLTAIDHQQARVTPLPPSASG